MSRMVYTLLRKWLLSTALLVASAPAQQTIRTVGPVFTGPLGVAVDTAGNIYLSDSDLHVVYRLTQSGTATVVAGNGTAGMSGDGGPATAASLRYPRGVAVDTAGNLYIADSTNNRVRRVAANGTISTFAGGRSGLTTIGDNGPATQASLDNPYGVAADQSGNVYIADTGHHRIRKVDKSGLITTIAGRGAGSYSGDGGPATLASLRGPSDVAIDGGGNLYIADTSNHRIRRVSSLGVITTVAGSDNWGYSGDGGPATNAGLHAPYGVAVSVSSEIYIADTLSHRIRVVQSDGRILTVAGRGGSGFSGDGGPALQAQLYRPAGIAVRAGVVFVVDSFNRRLRRVSRSDDPPAAGGSGGGSTPMITSIGLPFLGNSGVTGNSFLEIYGANLSQTTRAWRTSDFAGASGPTTLEGVSVTVNGKAAVVQYVSPQQVNIVVPDDVVTGPVPVIVTNHLGRSTEMPVTRSLVAPTLYTSDHFLVGGRQYVMALTPDFQRFIGRVNMVPSFNLAEAKAGDSIILYAIGCGPTNPSVPAGSPAAESAPLTDRLEIQIGGLPARVTFGGLLKGTVGLYQFNVIIPDVPEGDHRIELSINGIRDSQNLYLAVGGRTSSPLPNPPTSGGGSEDMYRAPSEKLSFAIPSGWAIQGQRPSGVEIAPTTVTQGGGHRLGLSWTKAASTCMAEMENDDLLKRLAELEYTEWTRVTTPFRNEEYFAGRPITGTLGNRDRTSFIYATTFCRADYRVELVAFDLPASDIVLSARRSVLESLNFGDPPTLVGSWSSEPSGDSFVFTTNGVANLVSTGKGADCVGSYQTSTSPDGAIERVTFQFPTCRIEPPRGECSATLTHARAIFRCSNETRFEYIRSR